MSCWVGLGSMVEACPLDARHCRHCRPGVGVKQQEEARTSEVARRQGEVRKLEGVRTVVLEAADVASDLEEDSSYVDHRLEVARSAAGLPDVSAAEKDDRSCRTLTRRRRWSQQVSLTTAVLNGRMALRGKYWA